MNLHQIALDNPELVTTLANLQMVSASSRMIYGMSAHGGSDVAPAFLNLTQILDKARAHQMGWDREDDGWYDGDYDDGIRTLLSSDFGDNGESFSRYFKFDSRLNREFDETGPDGEMTPDEAADHYLNYIFGVGEPCGCGICNAGGDCCGRTFCTSVQIWPSGDRGVWYGVAHFSRNI